MAGRTIRQVANPRLVGRGHGEVAIEKVRRNRQTVLAVRGDNTEAPLAAGSDRCSGTIGERHC